MNSCRVEDYLQPGNPLPAAEKTRPPSSKTRSRSSSSSSLSSFSSSKGSPTTPLESSGIPFSWEHQPGVPKHLQGTCTTLTSSRSRHVYVISKHLPPPPLFSLPRGSSNRFNFDSVFASRRKKPAGTVHDPFFAALVACSKDQVAENCWKGPKACKSWAGRLNLDRLYASCKTNCAVLESQVLLPRPYRGSYDMLTNKSA
ncbi:uncharacterized protein LOC116264224 [Nymphaea colorata]|uniref:uncharacterized protein LOC116264224 n=1 Tax=Nymphaea colorata TaxID=210225 RepID=UPI00129E1C1D|nr:uncharacterized protein LOC116264224 [Nymphaea colorata]